VDRYIVLGPLTLVRPLVIPGGLAFAAVRASDARVWVAAGAAAISMLALESMLARAYAHRCSNHAVNGFTHLSSRSVTTNELRDLRGWSRGADTTRARP
jgi:hypothetical protein